MKANLTGSKVEYLIKIFIIPVALAIFFYYAPRWLDSRLADSIAKDIESSSDVSAEKKAELINNWRGVQFIKVCKSDDSEIANFRASLEREGTCGQYQRLQWSLWGAVVLVLGLLVNVICIFIFAARARRSREALISNFQVGYRLSVFTALTKLFLQIPLLAYGSFELTTLATDRYYPKLILLIVLGAIVAIIAGIKTLLSPVSMEFGERLAKHISSEDSPDLWQAIKKIADKLNTTVPDNIIVGMSPNFYVTELSVRHNAGIAKGKTLYLSHPFMKLLREDEVLAIVGHELGHFIGADTQLTREFYPMHHRAYEMLHQLAASGWAGFSSFYLLQLFSMAFSEVEKEASRQRELLADKKGAEATSVEVASKALVKIHVLSEAYNAYFLKNIGTASGQEVLSGQSSLYDFAKENLFGTPNFWKNLLGIKTSHPMDSHPPLGARLESLGFQISPEIAEKISADRTGRTAFMDWFEEKSGIFADLKKENEEILNRVKKATDIKQANYADPSDKKMLDDMFPPRSWKGSGFSLGVYIFLGGLCVAAAATVAIFVDAIAAHVIGGLVAVWLFTVTRNYWKNHAGSELQLNAGGLHYSGWNRPIMFSEIQEIKFVNNNGVIVATLCFKQKLPLIWKASIFRIKKKSETFNLGVFKGKSQAIAESIYRYFIREAPQLFEAVNQ